MLSKNRKWCHDLKIAFAPKLLVKKGVHSVLKVEYGSWCFELLGLAVLDLLHNC